jgi:2-C-methyl-D-erythritol 4-phosphate cytidylyltransferase
MNNKVHFIVLTGGSGSRMQSNLPKQFLEASGKPLMYYALLTLGNWNSRQKYAGGLVCVANGEFIEETKSIVQGVSNLFLFNNVVSGGSTRHESTQNGLYKLKQQTESDDVVFIHDGARPLISYSELDGLKNCFEEKTLQIASLAMPVYETVIRSVHEFDKHYYSQNIERENLFTVKTPQAMRCSLIDEFLTEITDPNLHPVTDLLTWSNGRHRCELAMSHIQNIKVTTPEDLRLVRNWLKSSRYEP